MFMQLIDSTYHSIVFLLPDCTILIMAQGNCQFMKNDVSLFEKSFAKLICKYKIFPFFKAFVDNIVSFAVPALCTLQ